jgi:hypothetical protein
MLTGSFCLEPRRYPPEVYVEQAIQLEFDLDVRGREAGRDEVDNQPCKAPAWQPPPHLTELSEDAVSPIEVRRLPMRVGSWHDGTHEAEALSIVPLFTLLEMLFGCRP